MTEQQKRLWLDMISLIQDYIEGKIDDFYSMVGKLEGALDVSEIKNKELIMKWYDYWTPLETRRAIEGNMVTKDKALPELLAMKRFLAMQLEINQK